MSKSSQQAPRDDELFKQVLDIEWGDLRLINILHEETLWNIVKFIKQREEQAHEDGFVAGFLAGRNIPQGDVEQLDYDEAVLAHKIYSPSYFNRDVERLSLTTNKEKK